MAGNVDWTVRYSVSPPVTNAALNDLYAVSWGGHSEADFAPVLGRSLAYVCAFDGERLVGFVYLAWDGGVHAFLLEPTVRPAYRRRGIGRELVRRAVEAASGSGCEWVHVDYEASLEPFYAACGFRPTKAGLIHLGDAAPGVRVDAAEGR